VIGGLGTVVAINVVARVLVSSMPYTYVKTNEPPTQSTEANF